MSLVLKLLTAIPITIIIASFVGSSLDSNGINMAIGVMFGTLAGIPILIMAYVAFRKSWDQSQRPGPQITIHNTHNNFYVEIPSSVQRYTDRCGADNVIELEPGQWQLLKGGVEIKQVKVNKMITASA